MLTLLVLLTSIFAIHGSHFDGGSISYSVVGTNGSKLVVRITQSYTYVYPTIYCNNTYIANQLSLNFGSFGDATATLNCTANCSTSGGYTPIPVASKCTDYSAGMQITVGQRTEDVLISNGSYFVVANQGSAFRTLNLPGSGGSSLGWSISTVIDLLMRPDGTYNTPPKATMISPIYIPVGVQQKISIPTIDEDNDNVRCRFANGSNECGSVCPPSSLPSGTSISTNCTLTITGAVVGDWYAVAIQVEDFANSSTTTPYSSVPVQFLIHVYAEPNCTQRPYLYGPSFDGTCTGVQVGVPYTLTLYAENYCSSYNVTMVDIATQSFPVVIKTPIVQNTSTLWSVTLTWTPQADEVGPQVFCSVGIDSKSVQTNQYCLTFSVGSGTLGTCPGVELTTTEVMTTAALTTEAPTTVAPTTEAPTTIITTTEAPTTIITTTEAPTTIITTTEAPTTVAPTTVAPTTEAPTTVTTTTEPPTTTTTVENTTVANNTTLNMAVVIVPVVLIPICCCCCCCLFYFLRPCRTIDVERENKPVTTYTIEGAYVNKDALLIGMDYEINENDPSNIDSFTDTSYITLHDLTLNDEPLSSKASLPTDNDQNVYLPFTRKNVPYTVDTTSINSDLKRMMKNHDPLPLSSLIRGDFQTVPSDTENNNSGVPTTTSYDHYRPSYLSTRMNTPSALTMKRNNTFSDNSQQPIDLVSSTLSSQSTLSSNPHLRLNSDLKKPNTTRPTTRPWTKHPRWVLRLSKPKGSHTLPLASGRLFSRERPNNSLSSSARSTATIPRYAFYEE